MEPTVKHLQAGGVDRTDRWVWIAVTLVLAAFYGLLINPHWVISGDGDAYLGLARSIAQGDGYTHNGQVVGLVSPGWPLLLAGAMRVTDQFVLLKLLPASFGVAAFSLMYRVLRRYTGPLLAATSTLLVGLAWPTVQLSFWFFTELPFAFFCIAAVLIAQRIAEADAAARPSAWRTWGEPALLCILAAGAVLIRPNGVLLPTLVGAVLVSGQSLWRPRWHTTWIAAFMVAGVCFATFFVSRAAIAIDPADIDPRYPTHLAGEYEYVNSYDGSYTAWLIVDRIATAGRWVSGTFWVPVHDLKAPFRLITNALGWVVLMGAVGHTVAEAKRRRYWLLGVWAFWLPVLVTWPNIIPRYALPIMPLIVAAAVLGWARLFNISALGRTSAALPKIVTTTFVVGTAALNLPLLVMEVVIQRSTPFYEHYHGGVYRKLVAAGAYLDQHAAPDDGIGASTIRLRSGRSLERLGWVWAIHWLTDRPTEAIPLELSLDPTDSEAAASLVDRMQSRGLRWYVWQPPYHQWLHARRNPLKARREGDGLTWHISPGQAKAEDWQLWELVGDELVRVSVPAAPDWSRRVPAFEKNPPGPPRPATVVDGHTADESAGAVRANEE